MLGHAGGEGVMYRPLIVPKMGKQPKFSQDEKLAFDQNSYDLGRYTGIRDCIHYLKQQGYVVEEYDSDKHD